MSPHSKHSLVGLKYNEERRKAGIPHHNSLESYRQDGIEDQHPSKHMTDEHKANISKAAKAWASTPENKERVRKQMTGSTQSEDARQRLSVAMQGNNHSLGIEHTEEYKEAVRERQAATSNSNWVSMSIYTYPENDVVATNICLTAWCRENGYDRPSLWMTANDRIPEYRGLHAKYDYKE